MFFGQENVLKNGLYCGKEREKAIEKVIKGKEIVLTLNLNSGNEQARVYTCDLSPEYVKINAEYRS